MVQKTYTPDQIEFIAQCYQAHPSVNSIAAKYREKYGTIAEATVAKFLKANGYKTFSRGKKPPLSEAVKRGMMDAAFERDYEKPDLSRYPDYGKISFLSRRYTYYRWKWEIACTRTEFFDQFYFDQRFNQLFDIWKQNDHHELLTPSFDHIVPVTRQGTSTLDNIQCLPIWENRAKYNFTQDEWSEFKRRFVSCVS